jgi:hypothetical protein
MSHAEDYSKAVPVFVKLAVMLRNFPGLRFIFAKVAAWLRGNRGRREPSINEFIGEAPGVTISTVDQDAAVLKPSSNRAIAEPETDDQPEREGLIRRSEFIGEAPGVTISTVDQDAAVLMPSSNRAIVEPETDDRPEREKLIRRRWTETGIKMWNPDVHGAGHAALNIQGRVELLPPNPGETLPRYDKLEFKLVRSCVDGQAVDQIVCEGVVVDPPKRRSRHWSA